ncbi:MAG: formylglycine-generating enzyme family protein, partial [Gammaproteobacteria bacterium]
GGNAAEWVHDHYDIAAEESGAAALDPLGPESGEHHVIRGASWAHGGLTELRLSYRDYGLEGRDDVGFRIARYLE